MFTRADIVVAAKALIGTPFYHTGRVPRVGLDCAGVVVCVAETLGLQYKDYRRYSPQPDGSVLTTQLRSQLVLQEIACKDIQDGSILVFRIRRYPQHVAIKTPDGVIHAYNRNDDQRRTSLSKVQEEPLTLAWFTRVVTAFDFVGVK